MPAELLKPRLDLPQVTLVAASSIALPATLRAMRESMQQIRFGGAILFSDRLPEGETLDGIEWRRIAPLRSRRAYSEFFLRHLHAHVTTSHVLCVQWDGYVLDASHWRADFLGYDYIGAPWPHFDQGGSVGNGGFSLRSRRLLEACRDLDLAPGEAEDIAICRTHRAFLECERGIRFAPEEAARLFAYERHSPTGQEFGFHGAFNLARILPARMLRSILVELEPQVMARTEHRELLGWAVRNGRWSIVGQLVKRMWRRGQLRGEVR